MRASAFSGRTIGRTTALGAALVVAAAACTAPAAAPTAAPSTAPAASQPPAASEAPSAAVNDEPLDLAYLSFAVANSYDAPMLAAAQAAAAANNATITLIDAAIDPGAQTTQLQDAVASGQYDGIIVQPIYGAGLVEGVKTAIAAGVAVGNLDQVLGDDLTTSDVQVEGLSSNVVFVPSEIGRKMGELIVAACADTNPCEVGYIYSFKAPPSTRRSSTRSTRLRPSPHRDRRRGRGVLHDTTRPQGRAGHAHGRPGHRRDRGLGPGHHGRAPGGHRRRRRRHAQDSSATAAARSRSRTSGGQAVRDRDAAPRDRGPARHRAPHHGDPDEHAPPGVDSSRTCPTAAS